MYRLIAPKMRFSVVLTENPNRPKYHNNNNNHVCYADSYEIKADGSLTFYQTAILIGADNKKVKVPVMTYPAGKWDACVLIADDGSYPIFTGKGVLVSEESPTTQHQTPPPIREVFKEEIPTERTDSVDDENEDEPEEPRKGGFNPNAQPVIIQSDSQNTSQGDDAFDMLDSDFDNGNHAGTHSSNGFSKPVQNVSTNRNPSWQHTSQDQNQAAPQSLPFQQNSYHAAPQVGQGHMGQQPNMTIPGMNPQNTADFKKAKNDFIESQIKEHLRQVDKFELQNFLILINKESRQKNLGRISEADVEWVATRLIRDKVVLTKYFVDPIMQKTLSLDIKDILRRQWTGKMGPILQVLKEREKTKNVTAIDLAVWMVQNKFE